VFCAILEIVLGCIPIYILTRFATCVPLKYSLQESADFVVCLLPASEVLSSRCITCQATFFALLYFSSSRVLLVLMVTVVDFCTYFQRGNDDHGGSFFQFRARWQRKGNVCNDYATVQEQYYRSRVVQYAQT
jgi:hypothetical protein